MVMVKSSNNAPNLNFKFSLQKANELSNAHMNIICAMQCMVWKLEVKRRRMQKEPPILELWLRSYVHLKFHACFAMI
jgi:hypothetical protein